MMRAEMYSSGGLALIKRETVTDIEDKNMKLYILIMKHLDEEHIAIVNSELCPEKEGNGLELSEMLKEKYAGSEAHHQMIALGEFIDLEFKETKEFIREIRNGISKIRTSGLDMKEQVISLLILKKLPKEFESLIRIIIQDKDNLKVEDVIHKVERDYIQFKIKPEDKVAMMGQQPVPKKTGKC